MIEITNEDNMALMARYPDKYFDLAIVEKTPKPFENSRKIRIFKRQNRLKLELQTVSNNHN